MSDHAAVRYASTYGYPKGHCTKIGARAPLLRLRLPLKNYKIHSIRPKYESCQKMMKLCRNVLIGTIMVPCKNERNITAHMPALHGSFFSEMSGNLK